MVPLGKQPVSDALWRIQVGWSTLSLSNASLTGFEGCAAGGGGAEGGVSAMVRRAREAWY